MYVETGDLNGTCKDYLDSPMGSSPPPNAVLGKAVLGVGIICIVATLCGPGLCFLQWRRGTLWFFQLKRTSRGTYVACHPLNVFLLFSILAAACISILGIMTKVSQTGRSHMNLIPGLLVLQMIAWVFSGLSSFYLCLGTFLALPEGCEIPGLARLGRALQPLTHPYVINALTFGAPVVFIASSIPNIVLAPKYFTLAASIENVALDQMRSLSMQDPMALIPADVKLLILEYTAYELRAEKHVGITFVFTTLLALLIILIGFPSAYSLIFLLRRQLQDETKRVKRVYRDNTSGATEKALGTAPRMSGIGVHMTTSTDVKVDGPDLQRNDPNVDELSAGQRASTIAPSFTGPSKRSTADLQFGSCPVLPLRFEEPLTPTTPQSLTMSLPSSAADKDVVLVANLPELPKAPFVEESPAADGADKPTFLRNMRRRMSWSTRSQTATDSQRDKTAAVIRFKYLRRCFYTLASFYIFMCLLALVYFGLAFFIALVHLLPNNPLVHSISNLMLVFECVAAATLVMNFTLIGVRVFDSGTI